MENEIKLLYENGEEVLEKIIFEPIIAGQKTEKILYLQNLIDYQVGYIVEVTGEYVELENFKGEIPPKMKKELKLIFNPKMTLMKPINIKLKIKINYLVT